MPLCLVYFSIREIGTYICPPIPLPLPADLKIINKVRFLFILFSVFIILLFPVAYNCSEPFSRSQPNKYQNYKEWHTLFLFLLQHIKFFHALTEKEKEITNSMLIGGLFFTFFHFSFKLLKEYHS